MFRGAYSPLRDLSGLSDDENDVDERRARKRARKERRESRRRRAVKRKLRRRRDRRFLVVQRKGCRGCDDCLPCLELALAAEDLLGLGFDDDDDVQDEENFQERLLTLKRRRL